MAKVNPTAFILTVLVILGLFSLAGAIVWLGLKMQPNGQIPSLSTSDKPV